MYSLSRSLTRTRTTVYILNIHFPPSFPTTRAQAILQDTKSMGSPSTGIPASEPIEYDETTTVEETCRDIARRVKKAVERLSPVLEADAAAEKK